MALGGGRPGDGGGAGVQQPDADGLRTLTQLLQQLAGRTCNTFRLTGRVMMTSRTDHVTRLMTKKLNLNLIFVLFFIIKFELCKIEFNI